MSIIQIIRETWLKEEVISEPKNSLYNKFILGYNRSVQERGRIIMQRKIVGTKQFSTGIINITDPCYDKGVWCRMDKPIMNGTYTCVIEHDYYLDEYDGETYIEHKPTLMAVYKSDGKERIVPKKTWTKDYIGSVGVDSGLMSLCEEKPDFEADEWRKFTFSSEPKEACSNLYLMKKDNQGMTQEGYPIYYGQYDWGFWSMTAWGDISCDVYGYFDENKNPVGYEVDFGFRDFYDEEDEEDENEEYVEEE